MSCIFRALKGFIVGFGVAIFLMCSLSLDLCLVESIDFAGRRVGQV